MDYKIIEYISRQLNIDTATVKTVIAFFKEGATISFLARYRKEKTGGLDEVALQSLKEAYEEALLLIKRKEFILKTIKEQGKLTEQLRQKIEATFDPNILEDIYLPFKKKRKTRAAIAIENGLSPLADALQSQKEQNILMQAKKYVCEKYPTKEDVLKGVQDIIAERINEDAWVRKTVRDSFAKNAIITSKSVKSKEKEGIKYKDYFEYSESLKKCPSHRYLAIMRAENEGYVRVKAVPDAEDTTYPIIRKMVNKFKPSADIYLEAIQDSYNRLIEPSIENQTRSEKKLASDTQAIKVFSDNARQLLMAAPLGEKRIMGIDPGFRSGCKVVCMDKNGNFIENHTIYPHPPQSRHQDAAKLIAKLCAKYRIEAIAIGNGTAGRETYRFLKEVPYEGATPALFLVNEDGASIYSASKIAREEFGEHDLTVRGAISIARRLMDPLAELVKIEPKSIGVGQYQHDVNPTLLNNQLTATVESCVNKVGVNLNTASKHLLSYISGLGPSLAENIVNYREQNGAFTKIKDTKKVARLGNKAFEQCAGFLRIKNGDNPLDNTGVHPESYPIVKQLTKSLGCTLEELIHSKVLRNQLKLKDFVTDKIGIPTLQDIMEELDKPGLDPRANAKEIKFNDRINEITDLKEGMITNGIVNNITDFGAFIDLGIKESGLVHISQIANRFIKHPSDELVLNQEVTVKIIQIDLERKRIQLSMKEV